MRRAVVGTRNLSVYLPGKSLIRMAPAAARLERKEFEGRKEKTEREKQPRLIPSLSWKASRLADDFGSFKNC